jgi:shikimate dehydrogenase/3-dehydroquinate dehydratase type I
MTHLVASLVEGSASGVSDSSKLAFLAGADTIEVRLDHIKGLAPAHVREIRHAVRGPTIATLRSEAEGGTSRLRKADRHELLGAVAEAGFEFIDIETSRDQEVYESICDEDWRPQVIASKHFSEPVSRRDVEDAFEDAFAMGDVAKVAMACEDADQALMLARVGQDLARRRKRFAVIGMGAQGQLTRVFAKQIGSEFVYACMPGMQAAPGQLDVGKQAEMLSGSAVVLGLVGHPVSHSVSRPMQEAALKKAGLPGIYLPLDFPEGTFDKQTLKTARALGFKGLNVTIPHKGRAFEMSNRLRENARATEAANTLVFRGSFIEGENTDVFGFSRLIDGKITVSRGMKVLLVGAGGAARAVAYVLTERGARVSVLDKEKPRARALAKMFGAKAVTWAKLRKEKADFDLVVNCSPVGMKNLPGNPVKPWVFGSGKTFIDIIFNPPVTEAMHEAGKRATRSFSGLEMLVQQGAESFRIWTGTEPDVESMRDAAREALA